MGGSSHVGDTCLLEGPRRGISFRMGTVPYSRSAFMPASIQQVLNKQLLVRGEGGLRKQGVSSPFLG